MKKSIKISCILIAIGLILISCSVCITLIQRSHEVMRISIHHTSPMATYYFAVTDHGTIYYAYGVRWNPSLKKTPYLIWKTESAKTKITKEELQELRRMAEEVKNCFGESKKKSRHDTWDAAVLYDGEVYEINWGSGWRQKETLQLIERVIELSGQTVQYKGWPTK